MSNTVEASLEERVEKLEALLEGRPDLVPEPGELPDELVIYFDPPIKGALGAEHDAISLREPTVAEYEKARKAAKGRDNGDVEMGRVLVRLVSGTNEELVANMPVRKFKEATEYLLRFF